MHYLFLQGDLGLDMQVVSETFSPLSSNNPEKSVCEGMYLCMKRENRTPKKVMMGTQRAPANHTCVQMCVNRIYWHEEHHENVCMCISSCAQVSPTAAR